MRILSLLLSFLVAVTVAVAGLIYLQERVGQQRIYVQDHWLSSSEPAAYRSYGERGNTPEQ